MDVNPSEEVLEDVHRQITKIIEVISYDTMKCLSKEFPADSKGTPRSLMECDARRVFVGFGYSTDVGGLKSCGLRHRTNVGVIDDAATTYTPHVGRPCCCPDCFPSHLR